VSEKEKPKIEQVGPMDPSKRNSPIAEGHSEEVSTQKRAPILCYWNGVAYSNGARILSNGHYYECMNGEWNINPQ